MHVRFTLYFSQHLVPFFCHSFVLLLFFFLSSFHFILPSFPFLSVPSFSSSCPSFLHHSFIANFQLHLSFHSFSLILTHSIPFPLFLRTPFLFPYSYSLHSFSLILTHSIPFPLFLLTPLLFPYSNSYSLHSFSLILILTHSIPFPLFLLTFYELQSEDILM